MPTPEQITAARTALNRLELALSSMAAMATDPQISGLLASAKRDLATARFNIS